MHVSNCIHLPTDLQPPIINSTNVTAVNEGDDLTLSCNHLNSFPVTQFYWRTPNGSIITGTVNLALMLQFTDIFRSSSGNYTCTAQDDRSNTVSSTVTIIVQCKLVCACVVEGSRVKGGEEGVTGGGRGGGEGWLSLPCAHLGWVCYNHIWK